MSNDIIVTAPVVVNTNSGASLAPNVGDATGPISGGRPSAETRETQQIISSGYLEQSAPLAADVANSNKSDKEKKETLLQWVRNCVFLNICIQEREEGDTSWGSRIFKRFYSDERFNFNLNKTPDKLYANPYSVVSALSNYLWGNGRTMNIDIKDMGLALKPQNIPGFMDRVNAIGTPGHHTITMPFAYSTASSNIYLGYILGNITLQADGTMTRAASGGWEFQGTIRAYKPDTYNFDASTHRSKVAEAMTTVGRYLGKSYSGKPFKININGQIPIKM